MRTYFPAEGGAQGKFSLNIDPKGEVDPSGNNLMQ